MLSVCLRNAPDATGNTNKSVHIESKDGIHVFSALSSMVASLRTGLVEASIFVTTGAVCPRHPFLCLPAHEAAKHLAHMHLLDLLCPSLCLARRVRLYTSVIARSPSCAPSASSASLDAFISTSLPCCSSLAMAVPIVFPNHMELLLHFQSTAASLMPGLARSHEQHISEATTTQPQPVCRLSSCRSVVLPAHRIDSLA